MEEGERESDIRESTNEGNNDRYTQVENDVLFNPIEGYDEKEGENLDNAGETKENEKAKKYIVDDGTKKKEFKKLKIIMLGEVGVGKTSLIDRYVSNKFNNFTQATIGPDIRKKKVEIDQNLTADLLINDTTNEEKLGKFTKNYYLDAHGALLVYDLTNEKSFKKLKYWMDELNSNAPRDIIICILGNKADLTADRSVKYEDAKDFAEDNLYYEVSAKTGNNVSLAFEQLTIGIIEKQREEENNPDKVLRGKEGRKTTDLNDINKELMSKKKCC
jgi:small GTP-binding protein